MMQRILRRKSCVCFPLSVVTLIQKCLTIKEFMERATRIGWLFGKVKAIAAIYIDILKDFYLLLIIFLTRVGIESLKMFPMNLTPVIVFCLFTSIFAPMIISSLMLGLTKIKDMEIESGEKLPTSRKFTLL